MSKKFIVTGANGCLGYNLCQRLVNTDSIIYAVVNPNSKNSAINDLVNKKANLHLLFCDLAKKDEIINQLQIRADIFFHFAAYGVHRSDSTLHKFSQINIEALKEILNLASNRYQRIVVSGTGFEYQEPNMAIESSSLLQNRKLNPYAWSKRAAFDIAKKYTGTQITWLRPYTIYGKNEALSRLIPYLFDCAIRDIQPTLKTPDLVRDFLYIDDFLDATQHIINSTTAKFDVYNIGSGQGTKVIDIAKKIFQLCGKELIWHLPVESISSRTDPDTFVANIEKVKQLGWTPKVSLQQGMEKLLHEYKK